MISMRFIGALRGDSQLQELLLGVGGGADRDLSCPRNLHEILDKGFAVYLHLEGLRPMTSKGLAAFLMILIRGAASFISVAPLTPSGY